MELGTGLHPVEQLLQGSGENQTVPLETGGFFNFFNGNVLTSSGVFILIKKLQDYSVVDGSDEVSKGGDKESSFFGTGVGRVTVGAIELLGLHNRYSPLC